MRKIFLPILITLVLPCLSNAETLEEDGSDSALCSLESDFRVIEGDDFITEEGQVVKLMFREGKFLLCDDPRLKIDGVGLEGRVGDESCRGEKREDGFQVFKGDKYCYCDIVGYDHVEVGVPLKIHNCGYFIKSNVIKFVDDATLYFTNSGVDHCCIEFSSASEKYNADGLDDLSYEELEDLYVKAYAMEFFNKDESEARKVLKLDDDWSEGSESVGEELKGQRRIMSAFIRYIMSNLSPESAKEFYEAKSCQQKEMVPQFSFVKVTANGKGNIVPIRDFIDFEKVVFNITIKDAKVQIGRN